MGSVIKKRRKRMAKKKHRKLLRKTRPSVATRSEPRRRHRLNGRTRPPLPGSRAGSVASGPPSGTVEPPSGPLRAPGPFGSGAWPRWLMGRVCPVLGGRFARMLSTGGEVRQVIGVDSSSRPPRHRRHRVRARRHPHPVIAKVIEPPARPTTVVHMNVIATPCTPAVGSRGRRSTSSGHALLAACQKSAGWKRLVVK